MALGTSDDRADSKSTSGAASTGGRGRDGFGASSAASRSDTATKGDRVGSGGFSGGKSGESQGGRGRDGVSASTASSASKGDRVGSGSYSGSQASTGGRGRDGVSASTATGMGDRVGSGSYGATSAASEGGRGRGGFSAAGDMSRATGLGVASTGGRGREGYAASSAPGYSSMQEAQRGMLSQGVTGLRGSMVPAEPTYRQAEVKSMSQYNAIENTLGMIKAAEARKTDPYNGLVNGTNTPTHANLTGMTIADVQAYQKEMLRAGHASTAVGAYQMRSATLAEQVKRSGLDPNTTKFSKSVQDQLAMGLIENRARQATVNGAVDPDKFAKALAQEWAGLATTTGKSYYAGVGNNAATVDYGRVASAASGLVDTGMARKGVSASAPDTMIAANVPTPKARPFSEKYLSPTKTASNTPVPADKPAKQRGLGKTIAGLGVDAGIGMIPGIGMGASVINAGLSLAGKPTIGQMMVDNMGNPVHIGEDATGYADAGGSSKVDKAPPKTQASKVAEATPVETFGSKYLGWTDSTKRPTPNEKWGTADTYGRSEYS